MIRPMKAAPLVRLLLLLACDALVSAPAHAHHDWRDTDASGFAARTVAEHRISLQEAVERVQRATGGRVLDAKDNGDHYRIKVLTRGGEVRVVIVDAATGNMK